MMHLIRPAQVAMVVDGGSRSRYASLRPRVVAPSTKRMTACCEDDYHLIHFEGANLLFVDGHVKWSLKQNIGWPMFGYRLVGNNAFPDPEIIAY